MSRFGKDNPDMRFGLEIRDLTDILRNSGFKLFRELALRRRRDQGHRVPKPENSLP